MSWLLKPARSCTVFTLLLFASSLEAAAQTQRGVVAGTSVQSPIMPRSPYGTTVPGVTKPAPKARPAAAFKTNPAASRSGGVND